MLKTLWSWRRTKTDKTDEMLSAYLDGMLPLDERAAVEARLRKEPDLVARLDGLRLAVRALRDLPEVQVPRNFILSPSMVGQTEAARRPRQRKLWSVFGWATAAAALIFLLVFGSDIFIVAPSLRSPQASSGAEELQTIVETPVLRAIPDVTLEKEVPPAEVEAFAQSQEEETAEAQVASEAVESEVTVEAEVAAEAESVVEAGTPTAAARGMMGAAAPKVGGGTATTAADVSEKVSEVEGRAVEEGEPSLALTAPTPESAYAQSEEAVEGRAVEETVASTPEPSPSVVAQAVPHIASPYPEVEDGDIATQTSPEQVSTPGAVVMVPLEAPPAADTGRMNKSVPLWLRLLEVGSGLAVVVLGSVTLVLRRRKA